MVSDQVGHVPAYSIIRDRQGRIGYVGTNNTSLSVKLIGRDGKVFLLAPDEWVDIIKAPGEIVREWMLIYSGSLG